MTTRNERPTLPGCDVLPPMEPANGSRDRQQRKPATEKARGKPKSRKTADRFTVLNTFADFTMRDLIRAEIAVWVLLWRDTRNGTARTSQADLAKRAGVDVSTVKRAIARLERRALLTVVFRGSLWHGPSRYAIHSLPRPNSERQNRQTIPPK